MKIVNWDRLGIGLSLLCAIHCVATPMIILSVPIMARYYLAHPYFHLILALMIIPVGMVAFIHGFTHHKNYLVLLLGIPGLFIVTGIPYLIHRLQFDLNEPIFMTIGSGLLILAHWNNRRRCQTCKH